MSSRMLKAIRSRLRNPFRNCKLFSCFRKKRTDHSIQSVVEEPTIEPNNIICLEERPEQNLESGTDICQETPLTPDTEICQEEEQPVQQESNNISPCHFQNMMEETDPHPDTCEEPPEDPGYNTCQEETPGQDLESGTDICQETPEVPAPDLCQELDWEYNSWYERCIREEALMQMSEEGLQEETREKAMESGPDICQETPEVPDPKTCQELDWEYNSWYERCIREEALMQMSVEGHQEETPEETMESGTNICQETPEVPTPETCQETPQESGSNICQPEVPEAEQVGAQNTKEHETPSLAEKFPEPGRFLKLGEPIGEDPNGVIYVAWLRSQKKEVAITIIQDVEKQNKILNEIEVLEKITGHRNISDFYGAFYFTASVRASPYEGLWISTEICTGETVQSLINTKKSFGQGWISYICKEILKGLYHLERQEVMLHDLSLKNMVITSSADVKICEFTIATLGARSSSTSGPLPYMAPEVLANFEKPSTEYDFKADIWSLGIAAIYMAEGHLPFSKLPRTKLIRRVIHGPAPTLAQEKWSKNFHGFVSECLQKSAERRPSARQLLAHPFISELWDERGVKRSLMRHVQ
ncbi:STE20/SPS1-related proline-alanine-rich protein kinase-like isoform X3 [Xenopus tropicalis]|uniref:STE20/SPS1-related proline-alanine-rich protein kinase-like isoform X3 n=1 Tax=Xenopus tropicalis TaxID=8364 RepID=A0A8J1J5G2_XENTR|nr:STE20/SPS1-related proline-alanine-rich protein kinase-like isoform X3 [Xenopus tropicalis]